MATMPTYGGFKATVNTFGNTQTNYANPKVPDLAPDFSKMSDALAKFVEDQDDARVTAALTDLRRKAIDQRAGENGYLKLQGENALLPDDQGNSLVQRVDKELHDFGDELSKNMTGRQRKKFAEKAQSVYTSAYSGVSGYLNNESIKYMSQAPKDAIGVSVESGASLYDDPIGLAEAERVIKEQAATLARVEGWTPDQTQTQTLKNTSAMYANAIAQFLADAENDPRAAYKALAMLDAHKSSMTGSDALRLRKEINNHLDAYRIQSLADAAGSAIGSRMLSRDDPGYNAIVAGMPPAERAKTSSQLFLGGIVPEGGGMQENHEVSKDPAQNHYGISKLSLPVAAAAAKRAGIVWDEKAFLKDTTYNAQIGLAAMDHFLAKYSGDQDKAIAAYRVGDDVVDRADQAAERGEAASWFDALPEDAQQYVMNVKRAMEQQIRTAPTDSSGNPMSSFHPGRAAKDFSAWGMTWEEAERFVVQHDAKARTNPMYREKAAAAVMSANSKSMADYKANRQRIVAGLTEKIWQAHGDLSQISPADWAQATIAEQNDLIKYAQKILKGDQGTNIALKAQLMNNKDLLLSLTENELNLLRGELSPSDFKEVANEYYKQKTIYQKGTDERARELRDVSMGIIPDAYTGKASWGDAQRAAQLAYGDGWDSLNKNQQADITYAVQTASALAFAQNGGALQGNLGIMKILRPNLQSVVRVSNWWGDSNKTLLSLKPSDLPDRGPTDAYAVLEELARTMYGHDPSDQEMRQAFIGVMLVNGAYFPVPQSVIEKLDGAVVDRIQADLRAQGRRPLAGADLLQAYFIRRLGGVPEEKKERGGSPFDALPTDPSFMGDY